MDNDLIAVTQSSLLEARMDAEKFPRLCRISRDEAVGQLTRIVTNAFLYRGQTADPNNVIFISTSLYDELMQEEKWGARWLTIPEVTHAVKTAILNEEVFISVSSLYRIILDYCKGEGNRLQQQATELKRKQDADALRNSVIAPMLQAYTGELIKHSKTK